MLDEYAWLAICFVIFVIIAYKPAKKAILGFLDERIKQIKWEIDSAKIAKKNSQQALDELKADLKLVKKRHEQMIAMAKLEIEKKFQDHCAQFEKSLEYTQNAAKENIEQIQKDALKNMEKEFLDRVLHLVASYFDKKNSAELDLAVVSTNANIQRQRK